MANGPKEMWGVSFSWSRDGFGDRLIAEWNEAAVPRDLVHHLLGYVDAPTGGSIKWMDGQPAVSVHLVITFGSEEIPF